MRWSKADLADTLFRRDQAKTRPQRKPVVRIAAKPTETKIHMAVVQHLSMRGVPDLVFWHTPNGEVREKRVASKLKAMGTLPGIPDLVLLHRGRLYGLEIKLEGGRLSVDQHRVLRALEEAGAITATAYGLDDALGILDTWGLLRPARPSLCRGGAPVHSR